MRLARFSDERDCFHDVLKRETFRVVLYKFDGLRRHQFIESVKLASIFTQIWVFWQLLNSRIFGPWAYLTSWIITLHKLILILRNFQKLWWKFIHSPKVMKVSNRNAWGTLYYIVLENKMNCGTSQNDVRNYENLWLLSNLTALVQMKIRLEVHTYSSLTDFRNCCDL